MANQYTYLFLVFFVSFTYFSSSYAYNQVPVGGSDGWVLNPSESYTQWAQRLRFQVNDTLLFKYNNQSDSVLVVNKNDYDNCNTANPILTLNGGDSIFTFDRSGPFFFITGNKSNCDQGQKLNVVVLAVRNRPTPPQGSTSPSPSPGGGAAAPSGSPPSSSPSPAGGAPAPAGSPYSPSPAGGAPAPAGSPSSQSPASGAPAPETAGFGPSPAEGTSPTTGASPPSSTTPGSGDSSTPGGGAPGDAGNTPGSGNTPADANTPSFAGRARTPSVVVLVSTFSLVLGFCGFMVSF